NWQSVFFINAPVGVLALVLGLLLLVDHRAEKAPRSFDIPGIVLLSGAMFCLIWALIKAADWHWGDQRTLLFLGLAAVCFAVFVFWEGRTPEPLLPLSMFRSVALSAGSVLMVLMAFGFMGGLFFVTFYLQNVHGLSPVDSGLRLLPLTATMIIASPLAGALITKFGPRLPLVISMVITAVSMYGLSRLDVDSGSVEMSVWFALLGFGLGPVMVGATEVIVGNAPIQHAGVAGGLQQAAMQVGGSRGTARLGAGRGGKVGDTQPGKWAGAGLPPMPEGAASKASDAVEVGIAPVPKGTQPEIAAKITAVAHDTFVSGMGLAFTVAAVVSAVAALVAGFTKRGDNAEAAGGAVHI
ncbi:MFS transporter, partial [Streptomyces milbemycinicus]